MGYNGAMSSIFLKKCSKFDVDSRNESKRW